MVCGFGLISLRLCVLELPFQIAEVAVNLMPFKQSKQALPLLLERQYFLLDGFAPQLEPVLTRPLLCQCFFDLLNVCLGRFAIRAQFHVAMAIRCALLRPNPFALPHDFIEFVYSALSLSRFTFQPFVVL